MASDRPAVIRSAARPLALARSTVDRHGELRADDALLDRLWRQPSTRVLVVREGRAALTPDGDGHPGLLLHPPQDLSIGPNTLRVYLGALDGLDFVAVLEADAPETSPEEALTDSVRWAGLREVGGLLDDRDAGLMTQAVSIANWHAAHPCCSRCGAPTEPVLAGWVRRCPSDASDHHPRSDPAVIMAVLDVPADDEERILLGRAPSWPERRFSTLAGFVEPGESLEAAVRREVHEETGVVIGDDVTYRGSQPWPFPSSLMVGFSAVATQTDVRVDGVEISEARWFTRAELEQQSRDGELLLPSGISIARHLVEDWYGSELPTQGVWR